MPTRMTLGTKLTAGFGAMLGLSSILSLGALTALSSLRHRFDNAVNTTAKKLELAGQLDETQSKMLMNQRGILLYALLHDRARMDLCKEGFNKDAASMRVLLREFRPLISIERGRQLNQSIEAALDQWLSNYQRILDLAYANQAEQAATVGRDKVLPLHDAISKAAGELVDMQKSFLAADKEAIEGSYALHRWITVAGLLLSLVLGAGVLLTVRGANRTLKLVASQISDSSTQVSSAASQVASSSQSLAQGASEQAASLEQTSASTEEITSMTRKNAENSQAVAKLMAETESRVGGANQALDQMVASMSEIDQSSDKVSKIIKVIDEIAFQTNILALNAAVEAARAGEAGMGFAVVADEVRNLAQRSAQAAKDTAVLIEDSIAHSKEGATRLDQVAEAIRNITASAGQVKMLVDEVSLGSQEQARGIEQIAKAVAQMQQVTQKTAANAEESASASEEMAAQAESMKQFADELQQVVGSDSIQSALPVPAKSGRSPHRTVALAATGMSTATLHPPAGKRAAAADNFPLEGDFQEF